MHCTSDPSLSWREARQKAGGAGNFGKNMNYAAGKKADIAGAVGGFSVRHGRNMMNHAGSKAKEIAGKLFHRGGNQSSELSEQKLKSYGI